MLILSIKDNVSYILLIWFLGCTIVGGCLIYLAIIYKGFAIGYTCAALVASIESKVGIMLILSTFVLQNMILIPGIFLIAENEEVVHFYEKIGFVKQEEEYLEDGVYHLLMKYSSSDCQKNCNCTK